MYGLGPCWSCKRPFAFNVDKVPSVVVARCGKCGFACPPDVMPTLQCTDGEAHAARPGTSQREPLCRECVARINVERHRRGEPLIDVLDGAYPEDE
jgi:hypothetical protein